MMACNTLINSTISHRVGIRNISDYSPFGVLLPERTVESAFFRKGYQGSERDDEFKGKGNNYTTTFRQLDPRIGKWLTTDPEIQPWQSPYCSMDNNPVMYNDVLGLYTKHEAKQVAKEARKSGANAEIIKQAIGNKKDYWVHVTLESNKPGAFFEKTFTKIKYDKNKLVLTDYSNEGPGGPELTYGFYKQNENEWKILEADWAKTRKKWDNFEEGAQDYFELMATVLSGAETVEGLYALGRWGVTKLTTRSATKDAVEGIYEFTAASGKTYVGQSSNIAKRLEQHVASGKLLPGTSVKTTEVLGGKTSREITEQLRINSLGGIKNLENIRNPIGPARQHLLPKIP